MISNIKKTIRVALQVAEGLKDQSPYQKLHFGNSTYKVRKIRYQSFLILPNLTGFLYFVSISLPEIAVFLFVYLFYMQFNLVTVKLLIDF